MDPSPSPSAIRAGGWDDFVTWVSGDPGDVATFLGVAFTFIAAGVAAWISWKSYSATKVHGERELGMQRYQIAIQHMHGKPKNVALATEGARILKSLLRSKWPTKEDREMVEEALAEYTKQLTGGAP
jgi:hypothetical protein